MKKIIALIVLINSLAYSQGVAKPPLTENIQSPNAGSLGKYGDVPVSLYTGTPDVNVPIYQINEGGIPLIIALDYDASGVRVNSVPGWVGQNWSLQAGGVITRNIRGNNPDEADLARGYTSQTLPTYVHYSELCSNPPQQSLSQFLSWPNSTRSLSQGYKYKVNELNLSDWASTNNLLLKGQKTRDAVPNLGGFTSVEAMKNIRPDYEPDFFIFNFMGHTGKFFLGQDGEWKVSSNSNLKVICDFSQDVVVPASIPAPVPITGSNCFPSEFPRIINKITILDDQGNKYIFGTNEATELTFPNFFNQRSTPIESSAFYLQSVYDAFGNQVYKFEYQKGPYIAHFYLNWGARNSGNPSEDTNYTASADNTNNCDSSGAIKAPGQLILPVYLKKITTKSGSTIEFNSSISDAMKFSMNDNPIFTPNSYYNNYLQPLENDWWYFSKRLLDFSTLDPNAQSITNPNGETVLTALKWKKLDNITIKDNKSNVLMNVNLNYINTPTRRLFLQNMNFNTSKIYSFEYYNDNLLPNFLSTAIDHLGYFNGTRFTFTCNTRAYTFWRNFHLQRATHAEKVLYGTLKKIIYPTKGFTEFEFEPHSYSKEIDKLGNLITSAMPGIMGGVRIRKIINNDGKGNNYVKEYQYTNTINSSVSSGNLLFKPNYILENINLPWYTNGTVTSNSGMNEISISPLIPLTNLMGNKIEYETVIEKNSFFNSAETRSNFNGYTIYKYSNYSQFPDGAPTNCIVPTYNPLFPMTDRSFERGQLLEKIVYDVSNTMQKRNTFQYQSNQNLKINAIKFGRIVLDNNNTSFYDDLTSAYQIFYADKYISDETEELFTSTGVITNIKKYSYKGYPEQAGSILNFGDIYKSTEYIKTNDGGILNTYKYPFDYTTSIDISMCNNRILPLVYGKEERVVGDPYNPSSTDPLSEEKVNYTTITNSYGGLVQVPESKLQKKGNNTLETKFRYVSYDGNGNLLEYKTENGISISIVWGYNFTKPVARLENITYASIPTGLINSIQTTTSSTTSTDAQIIVSINALRSSTDSNMQNANITTYTYNGYGINSITDPKENTITYIYDAFGRLKETRDKDNNILSENEYHYKN